MQSMGVGVGGLAFTVAREPTGQGWAHPSREAPGSQPTSPESSPWGGHLVARAVMEGAGHQIFSWNCSDGASLGLSLPVIYHSNLEAGAPTLPLICWGTWPRCPAWEETTAVGFFAEMGGGGRGLQEEEGEGSESRQVGPRHGPTSGSGGFLEGLLEARAEDAGEFTPPVRRVLINGSFSLGLARMPPEKPKVSHWKPTVSHWKTMVLRG